jgi:hypothetical protein
MIHCLNVPDFNHASHPLKFPIIPVDKQFIQTPGGFSAF